MRRKNHHLLSIWLLSMLVLLCCAPTLANSFDYRVVNNRKKYIHMVQIDPKAYQIDLIRSQMVDEHLEDLDEIGDRTKAELAVNGGFFYFNRNGDPLPSGAFKIDHTWVSGTSRPRAALGWTQQKSIMDNVIVKIKKNKTLIVPQRSHSTQWSSMQHVVGGIPLLVANGKVISNFEQEQIKSHHFVYEPNARTAIGFLPNGHWLIVVVEQRYKPKGGYLNFDLIKEYIQKSDTNAKSALKREYIVTLPGMTIPELARFMKNQGCEWAINLDGGGSSGLYYKGKVRTKMADDTFGYTPHYLRQIHNAIVFRSI